jgi:hypothetical protein
MKKLWLALLTLIACGPAMAQIEAGEWEFTSVSTSRLFPGPQNASFRRCIPKEEAANPDRWMSNPGPQSDCKITPGAKTANTYSWQMECPAAKMRGNGTARMTASTMDGETVMNGEVQGQKFELRTKVTGKRLGPCKG